MNESKTKISIEDIHKLITGYKYKRFTDAIRALTTKAEQNVIKQNSLDYVTFSGIFEGRSLESLKMHSNLLCIDFDDIPNVANARQQILDTLPPYLLFISPRGEGLKVVYKIAVTDTNTHLMYYHAFEHFFKSELGLKTDAACKDIPRPCFLCHDSESYLNSNVDVLNHSFIDTFYIEKNEPTKKQISESLKCIAQSENQFDNTGLKCWDDFNNKNSILDIVSSELEVVREYGNKIVIKRYGASSTHSGYISKDTNLMYLFSDGTIYEALKGYTPFAAYCLKHHNGDPSAAAKDIYKLGYGDRIKKKKGTKKTAKPVFIPIDILIKTLSRYEQNTFIQNLLKRVKFPFDADDIEKVISLYRLGTIDAAITFPFIDINHNVRAVQVKEFDKYNHTTGTDFLHSIIEKHHNRNNTPVPNWLTPYNGNETKVSCLFGEHLLSKYPHNPIALVEAPKTAIYGTLYFGLPEQPQNFVWLAVYNLSSLKLEKCKALKGRKVYLFPDLSKEGRAFELWSNKATEIQKELKGTYFQVSDLLEQLAPERDKSEGKDLADYLIKLDWRLFRQKEIREQPQPDPIEQPKVETLKSEKGEKDEAQTNFYFLQTDTTKQPKPSNKKVIGHDSEYQSLSYFTRMFWDYRGGKDEYTRHKTIMSNYGK